MAAARKVLQRWSPMAGLVFLLSGMLPAAVAEGGWFSQPRTLLLAVGDSLTHGTLDATNNRTNTEHAYLELVARRLKVEMPLVFTQPWFDDDGRRLYPFVIPTNLGVDGADIFSVAGQTYHRRQGEAEDRRDPALVADRLLPAGLRDVYDKVLYPINLLARQPVSQVEAAAWWLSDGVERRRLDRALVVFWAGNNDSSRAALGGGGGANPTFQPLPFAAVADELKPGLRWLLSFGEAQGALSFAPYTPWAIRRNLTTAVDFAVQYRKVVGELVAAAAGSAVETHILLVTLPYYNAVGYLMDSDDLEYYLGKLDPDYRVPASFKRVAPPGEPITDPLAGDRVSLYTFGMMYALLATGHSTAEVNAILADDGLVLSEWEQRMIMARIDAYNRAIRRVAADFAPVTQLLDLGDLLNRAFTGEVVVEIGGRALTRKWIRGGAFSHDGVHPGYTGQALFANQVLESLGELAGVAPEPWDLEAVQHTDPYLDRDGDGWAPGPDYPAHGITRLLYLFRDPDDSDGSVGVTIPPDVWATVSDVLLEEFLGVEVVRREAERMGLAPAAQ